MSRIENSFCTCWPDYLFGKDYSMSCWAHDEGYQSTSWRVKAHSDWMLFKDIWAIADICDTPAEKIGMKVNACLMGAAVSTAGWLIWIAKHHL